MEEKLEWTGDESIRVIFQGKERNEVSYVDFVFREEDKVYSSLDERLMVLVNNYIMDYFYTRDTSWIKSVKIELKD